ncbi:tapasin-related protein-like [Triplophysa dalaica]|uniref:tapasin-related protein-like n=1 Tax=Triplophysa dalaica TaxID=1582913 RepID=UPI0024DFC016|nr:tapasin-related protein-like [Triplophysa dalaica]
MIVPRKLYLMIWGLACFILTLLCLVVNGSESVADLQWLPCEFVDENVYLNEEGHIETQYIYKKAIIQFGYDGDRPLYPNITFLVTASRVDMRHYLEGDKDTLNCIIRRYNIGRIVMRWPAVGSQEYDIFFTCTLHHTKGAFNITTFLRHTPSPPAGGKVDFLQRLKIHDKDLLTTSAVMAVLTRTPYVEVGLLKEPTLHCQFAVDHKKANVRVEWIFQRHGERRTLFSYPSHTAITKGTGVSIKDIVAGNASLKLPPTRKTSEGTYICSIRVPPLNGSLNILVSLREQPHVSLNVDSTLSLTLGEYKKVMCDAERYYPLDVNIEWWREHVGVIPKPLLLDNVLHSSHKHDNDGLFSLSASFYLKPGLEDSGYKYTCKVSHKSLLTPIRKSFILSVTAPYSTMEYIIFFGSIVLMLRFLYQYLPQFIAARKAASKRI